VKTALALLGFKTHVSWHKSIGWKPSWRGYVVGAIFKNTSQAKQFLLQEVLPKLQSGEYPWFAKDVFDISSYQSGVDRCIGSAKLMVDEPDQMRFLDTSPLEHVSDLILTAIFHRCPNEYLVTVLGWIYPHFKTTCPEPHRLIVQGFGACPGSTSNKPNKRKRNDIITIDSVSNEEKERIQSMVTESLEAAGLAVGWTGSGAVHGWDKRDCEFVEIKASGTSYFCAHNECVELTPTTEWNQAVRKPNATPHTQNAGKIKFRLYLDPDERCKKGQNPFWLKQNCFSCKNTMRRVCSVNPKTVRGLVWKDSGSKANEAARAAEVLETSMTSRTSTMSKDLEVPKSLESVGVLNDRSMCMQDGISAKNQPFSGVVKLSRFMMNLHFV
jgi:hypothetical protein